MTGARPGRIADHRRKDQSRGRRVQGVFQTRQGADAAIIAAVLQIARGQHAHRDVVGRAERRQRDGERLAGAIAGDPVGEFEGAFQRLREGAGEAFGFGAERESLEFA